MTVESDYFDHLPTCLDCGQILPESWRLADDRATWECRNCRRVFGVHEVIR